MKFLNPLLVYLLAWALKHIWRGIRVSYLPNVSYPSFVTGWTQETQTGLQNTAWCVLSFWAWCVLSFWAAGTYRSRHPQDHPHWLLEWWHPLRLNLIHLKERHHASWDFFTKQRVPETEMGCRVFASLWFRENCWYACPCPCQKHLNNFALIKRKNAALLHLFAPKKCVYLA